MPYDTVVKVKGDGTITLKDSAAAETLEIAYEQGDLTINFPGDTITNVLDRGVIGSSPTVRKGDEQPMTGSFTAYLRDMSDATYTTLENILMQNSGGDFDNWVSTTGASNDVKTVHVHWAIGGAAVGGTDREIKLPHCYLTGSFAEGDPNVINVSFTSYAAAPDIVT